MSKNSVINAIIFTSRFSFLKNDVQLYDIEMVLKNLYYLNDVRYINVT